MKPAEPLHRDGPPGPQLVPRPRQHGDRVQLHGLGGAVGDGGEAEPGSALVARDRLGVIAPVRRIVVLRSTRAAHLERRHRRVEVDDELLDLPLAGNLNATVTLRAA